MAHILNKAWLSGVLLGFAVALVAAGPAHASTVTIANGNEVRVAETGNETNQIFVAYSAATDTYLVRDFAANLTPSGACVAINASTASCPGAGIASVEVSTDARADTILLDPLTIPTTVAGELNGGGDEDTLTGHRGKDDINGGSGRDLIDGGEGADDLNGGSGGNDSLLYVTRATPVIVTIGSGNDNDGNELDFSPGTLRDTVRGDIERVLTGIADDSIMGDSSSETLVGGDGNDTLIGNGGRDSLFGFGGDDVLIGGNGDDAIFGALGNDRLFGGLHDDRLVGGFDNDSLFGDNGVDRMKGKEGIDVIRARDGTRDRKINCGPGPNRLEFAKRDKRLDPKPKSC
jgi:Ca2+-binding RTX toxin-like protein